MFVQAPAGSRNDVGVLRLRIMQAPAGSGDDVVFAVAVSSLGLMTVPALSSDHIGVLGLMLVRVPASSGDEVFVAVAINSLGLMTVPAFLSDNTHTWLENFDTGHRGAVVDEHVLILGLGDVRAPEAA